jgi:hypothetical protein
MTTIKAKQEALEEQKQHLIDIMRADEELGLYEEPKQIKCYCGHTTYCDCSPLEEPKQETLEQASWRFNPLKKLDGEFLRAAFIKGAEWQQDRMYSEEESDYEKIKQALIKFRKTPMTFVPDEKMYSEEEVLGIFHEWFCYQIDEDVEIKLSFQQWFEQFKKK